LYYASGGLIVFDGSGVPRNGTRMAAVAGSPVAYKIAGPL